MLNYILPPIIIIISVSALIMFLFRKAEQISAEEFMAQQERSNAEKNRTKIMTVIGNFSLKFLEKLMQRSKLMSLKFHNVSNDWFQTIREKRQRATRMQQEARENSEREMMEMEKNEQAMRRAMESQNQTRPMVASKVTLPQPMLKEKNQLEDALIKRIAVNPKDIEAYERLGDYYLENQNFQDSLECFKQVLRLSPTHQKARLRIRRLERMR